MSEDVVKTLHPEVNWDLRHGEHLGVGQTGVYTYSRAMLAERMWRPFLRDRVLESTRSTYYLEACERDVTALMPANEQEGIDARATLTTMMAVARVLEARRAVLRRAGYSMRVVTACLDGSRWVSEEGERHVAAGLWFGCHPEGQPMAIAEYPPADGFRLHSRADIYEGELGAIDRFFYLAVRFAEAHSAACQQLLDESTGTAPSPPSSVEGLVVTDPYERLAFACTSDCEGPCYEQKHVFRSGDVRSLGAVRCLDLHESIARNLSRAHQDLSKVLESVPEAAPLLGKVVEIQGLVDNFNGRTGTSNKLKT